MDAINSSPLSGITNRALPAARAASEKPDQAAISDSFTPSSEGNSTKVCGTIGTAIGAGIGNLAALPVLGAVKAAALGGALLGPAGAIIGGIIGAGAGIFIEGKLHPGRILGGLIGGAAGMGVGKVLDKLGHKPSQALAEETKGFSYKTLFHKLMDPKFTSHKKISSEEVKDIMAKLQPGDLLIGNNDNGFTFEMVQKMIGSTGNWTHIAIQGKDDTVMEVMIPNMTDRSENRGEDFMTVLNRPYMENKTEDMLMRNHHVIVLRPNYKDKESIEKVFKAGREYSNVSYDMLFNLKSDDKHYCTEFAYKVLRKAAPEIDLKPSSFLGYKYISADDFIESPDVKVVHDTGSNFWHNYLSKYD
jgi:hypothetical protein